MSPQEFRLTLQTLPVEQFGSTVQRSKQTLPLQANGTHEIASGATQAPVAVQVAVGV